MTMVKKIALVCALMFGVAQFSTRVEGFVITAGTLAAAGAVAAGLALVGAGAGLVGSVGVSAINAIKGSSEEG